MSAPTITFGKLVSMRRLGLVVHLCTTVALCVASIHAQSNSTGQPSRIVMPSGWTLVPQTENSRITVIRNGEPRYSIEFYPMHGSSCARQFMDYAHHRDLERRHDPTLPSMTLASLPDFFPSSYAPLATFSESRTNGCLDLGSHAVQVSVDTRDDKKHLSSITPVLNAIAKAFLPSADYISAPGSAKLPTLGVEVKLESGQYFVKPFGLNGKPRDTIVRVNSAVPLDVSFVELKPTDDTGCSPLYNSAVHVRMQDAPPYLPARWYPKVGEWTAPGELQIQSCYAASPQLLLVAWIRYGKPEVSEQDTRLIRELLDHVADSVDRGPHTKGQVTETIAQFFANPNQAGGVIGGIIGSMPAAAPKVTPQTTNSVEEGRAIPSTPNSADSAEPPNPLGGIPIFVPGGTGGVIGGVISSSPPPSKVDSPMRVRLSPAVAQGLLSKTVHPIYPATARQAGIQGSVFLQAEIDKDGKVETLRLISGHPMLVPAAIEAVKQWVYRPYVLNGHAVAVETQLIVNFTLSE